MQTQLFIITALVLILLSAANSAAQVPENGSQKGEYKESFFDNGNIRYKGFFLNGRPVDTLTRFYNGGIIQAQQKFFTGSDSSFVILYYQSGKKAAEGLFIGREKTGTWNYYSFYNGRLALKENYLQGNRHGFTCKYYDNDEIAEKMEWKNGQKDGLWEQYYQDGTLRLKANHIEGLRHGKFVSFNSAGNKSIEGQYVEGVMHGSWTYYDDGKIDFVAEYEMGKMLPNEEVEKRAREFNKLIEENIGKIPEPNLNGIR